MDNEPSQEPISMKKVNQDYLFYIGGGGGGGGGWSTNALVVYGLPCKKNKKKNTQAPWL